MSSKTATSVSTDDLVSNASSLIPLLQDNAVEIDRSGVLPQDVIEAMAEAGVFRLGVPEEFGGPGLVPLRVQHEVLVELGRGSASAAWIVGVSSLNCWLMTIGWPELLGELFDSSHVGPYVAGSVFNPAASKGVGRAVQGGFTLTGRWSFASGVRQSAWLVGGADLTDEAGATYRAFVLIPRSDFEIEDDWHVEGMQGTNSNSVRVTEEVFVPQARVFRIQEFADIMRSRSEWALTVATAFAPSIILGCAKTALELFVEKATRSKPFGAPYDTLAAMPSTQIVTGRAKADIMLVDAALREGTEIADKARAREIDLEPGDFHTLRYAQVRGADLLRTDVEALQLTVGSSAAAEGDKLGRCARDIRVMCFHNFWRHDWIAEQAGRAVLGVEPWPPRADV